MLDAIENSDTSVHFSETDGTEDNRLVNRSLNRVARILHNVKRKPPNGRSTTSLSSTV